MIISRVSGGLGNQMFQYAIAKAMAINSNRTIKLDTSFYPQQTLRKYELFKFNIDENIAGNEECEKLRGKEGFVFKVKNRLNIKIKRPYSYIHESKVTFFDKDVYNRTDDIYLDGFWQNEEYFKSIRDKLIQNFTLKETISKNGRKYLKEVKNTESISLHVRRGDYVENTHTNSIHGTSNIEYYKKAIKYIYDTIETPTFYIFSDDISWCKENFHFLENKVFIDDTKNALEDLELMKHCKHNIIANSTFSWWGAWLNANKEKIVIAPKVWFNTNDLTLALDEWILI